MRRKFRGITVMLKNQFVRDSQPMKIAKSVRCRRQNFPRGEFLQEISEDCMFNLDEYPFCFDVFVVVLTMRGESGVFPSVSHHKQ